ncbi:MAG: class I SAM-dependent methyltransferase [Mycobacteriales bacterium]
MPLSGGVQEVAVDLVSPADLYDAALRAHNAGDFTALTARACGWSWTLPVARWCAETEDPDVAALAWLRTELPVRAAVIDLGCGPGRHSANLLAQGLRVLGVDISARAVELARARGVDARLGDVLGPLPAPVRGGGGWDAVLLLDGNIGLGGDPTLLLCRVRDLLTPRGVVLVELDKDGITDNVEVQLSDGVSNSTPFRWSRLGADRLADVACVAGLHVLGPRTIGGRVFALLVVCLSPD